METLNLINWQIIRNEFPELINNFHETFLTEDMFQIQQNDYIIDAGWYGNENGFITYLIYNYNWENPIIRIRSNSVEDCLSVINLIIEYLKKT